MEEKKEESEPKRSLFYFPLFNKLPAEAKPVDPSKLVTVDQLPMYSDEYSKCYTFIESSPLPMQKSISKVRQSATDQYGIFKDRFKEADQILNKSAKAVSSLSQQFKEEWTTVPKAMAIVIGGMAGYILGMRRSAFRRWLYSGTGLATMAAFCYPNEAVAVVHAGLEWGRTAWLNFQASPQPPANNSGTSKTHLSMPKVEESHNPVSNQELSDVANTSVERK